MSGSELTAWREARGYSRVQLASLLGVHYSAVAKWETQQRGVPAFMWRALEHIDCAPRTATEGTE